MILEKTPVDQYAAFAVECGDHGARRYILATYASFFNRYYALKASERNHYEVIRDGVPSKLYFDLEYEYAHNPTKRDKAHGDLMVHTLLKQVQIHLERDFNIFLELDGPEAEPSPVVDLASYASGKFSRHLIINLPRGIMFKNNQHGMYVCMYLYICVLKTCFSNVYTYIYIYIYRSIDIIISISLSLSLFSLD